jgi:hypothetical protein
MQPLSNEHLQELEKSAGMSLADLYESSMYGAGRVLHTEKDLSRDELGELITNLETVSWVRQACLSPKGSLSGYMRPAIDGQPIPCDKGILSLVFQSA